MTNAVNLAALAPVANTSGALISPTIASGSILNSSGRPMAAQTGGVLQVVQTNYTQQLSLAGSNSGGTSTTEASQFRCAITLSSTSSKVLVHFNVTGPVLIALDPLVMVTLDVTVCVFSYIGTEGANA